MQLQTILNKVQKFKGYVYENVTLSSSAADLGGDGVRERLT